MLDFDGVLHPDAAYRPPGRPIELHADGALLMHAPLLEQILDDHDPEGEMKIILSTSWVRVIGFSRTLARLPPGLRARVAGATWHSGMKRNPAIMPYGRDWGDPFDHMTRYEQIAWYVSRHAVQHWLALDDLHSGYEDWPQGMAHHLVLTDKTLGINSKRVVADLRQKLDAMKKAGGSGGSK